MKLKDYIGRRLADLVKGYLPGPRSAGFVASGYQDPKYDYKSLQKSFMLNSWVHRAVKVISDTLAAVPLKVYRETGTGAAIERSEVLDGPLVDLLFSPSPRMSQAQFLRALGAHFALNGEAIIFIENGTEGSRLGGSPKRLQVINPQHIDRVILGRNATISEYIYKQSGQEVRIAPEFIVHAMNFNPFDDTRGLPATKVAAQPILLATYMSRYNQMFFRNGAAPAGILTSKGPLSIDMRKRELEEWKKNYGGVDNAHRIAYLSDDTTYQSISINAREGEFINLGKLSREEILAIFGVPPFLVGVMEFANYANSSQQLVAFYQHTIQPLASAISDALNTHLVNVWYGVDSGLYVAFDFSGIEVLQEDKLRRAQIDSIYVRDGTITRNEIRRELDLPDIQGGDSPGAIGPSFGNPTLGLSIHGAPKHRDAVLPPTKDDQWYAFDGRMTKPEMTFAGVMGRYFLTQGQRIQQNLRALAEGRTVFGGNGSSEIKTVSVADLVRIFDLDEENTALMDAVRSPFKSIIDQFGKRALASVGSSAEFNLTDPRVVEFIRHKVMKITEVNQTTRNAVSQLIADAAATNATIDETARAIRDTFDEFAGARSVLIARTEVLGASNGAAVEGYRQSGVVTGKEWLTARDADVRESHAEIDGQVVGFDGVFSNGLSYPGGDGPPEEVCNCRCTVLPVLAD